MRLPYALSGAALGLLLVGAGCASTSTTAVDVSTPPQPTSAASVQIDAAVDGLADLSATELTTQQKEEAAANRVDDDEAVISAYGQADYAAR